MERCEGGLLCLAPLTEEASEVAARMFILFLRLSKNPILWRTELRLLFIS